MIKSKHSLPFQNKLCYGIASLGEGMLITTVAFYLLFFYTDVAGVNPAWAGIALFFGRFWDAVTDPIMGQISDRTKSRWGRRRPYLLFGSLPLGVSFLLLWMVPGGLPEWGKALYLGIIAVLYNTMHTVVIMPYLSLGAEMTLDYNERTSVTSYRQFFFNLGWLPSAFLFVFLGLFTSEITGYRAMGLVWAVVLCSGFVVTFIGGRENPEFQTRAGLPIGQAFRETFRNRAFIFLAIALFIAAWAFAFGGALWVYIVTYVIEKKEMMQYFLGLIVLSTIAFIPFYTWISERIGKKKAFTLNIVLYGVCHASGFILFRSDLPSLAFIFCAIHGAGAAGFAMLSASIVADIVDLDELRTGTRREGAYFGIMNLIMKTASSMGIAVVGFVLAWLKFVPNVEQTAECILGIKVAYTLFPFAVLVTTAAIFYRVFPLTPQKAAEVRGQLDARKVDKETGGIVE